jgi:trimeric autotransporter adhesin
MDGSRVLVVCALLGLPTIGGLARADQPDTIHVRIGTPTPITGVVPASLPQAPTPNPTPPAAPTPAPSPSPAIAEPAARFDAGDRMNAVPVTDADSSAADSVRPRYSFRSDFGDGVGYDNGYNSVEAFIPIRQTPGCSVMFLDGRLLNYDDSRYWESQLGAGQRWRVGDAILGVNGFYNGRNSDIHWYNEAGVGVELLGRCWEARANAYIPVGPQRFLVSNNGFSDPRFAGFNILLDHSQTFESSMGGFDAEIGRQLPSWLSYVRTSAYVGFYHYDNDRVQTANGVRGRLESWIGDNVSLNLQVQNDAVFNTTVTGGIAIHWGGVSRRARETDPVAAKLGDRVVRDPAIVLQRKVDVTTEKAIDPTTGAPIVVEHVASYVNAGGDGSFEHPFQTLAQLQAGSAPNQILFVHGGSIFLNQSITLQPNQRFLGEGIDHTFTATQGTFLLPRATTFNTTPIITNPAGTVVTMANGTEVSGFVITGATGIAAPNVSGGLIDRNQISGTVNAINVINGNPNGSMSIEGNSFAGVVNVTELGPNGTYSIRNNTFDASSSLQLAENSGIGRFRVDNNVFLNPSNAVITAVGSGATMTTQFANNMGPPGPGTFTFINILGTLNLEDTLATNAPMPTITNIGGTVNTVPVGSAGFGPP